jgi:hypothetical protein
VNPLLDSNNSNKLLDYSKIILKIRPRNDPSIYSTTLAVTLDQSYPIGEREIAASRST